MQHQAGIWWEALGVEARQCLSIGSVPYSTRLENRRIDGELRRWECIPGIIEGSGAEVSDVGGVICRAKERESRNSWKVILVVVGDAGRK